MLLLQSHSLTAMLLVLINLTIRNLGFVLDSAVDNDKEKQEDDVKNIRSVIRIKQ